MNADKRKLFKRMIFAQEFIFDVLGWLVLRDIESSRQMFQLVLDDMQE